MLSPSVLLLLTHPRWGTPMKRMLVALTSTLCVCLLAACSSLEADPEENPYPPALNLPLVELDVLKETWPAPDSVNLVGYVVGAAVCPESALCIIGDQLYIGASPTDLPVEGLILQTIVPPYELNVKYVFSLSLSERVLSESEIVRDFRLLGFSPVLLAEGLPHRLSFDPNAQ